MKITEHLSLKEFIHSDTAVRKGISNEMNSVQTLRAVDICTHIFEPLREFVGKPIKINSGFRSIELNEALRGSSTTSQHMKGEALDLPIDSEAFHFIKDNLPFDQLIWEHGNENKPQWVHVSFHKEKNRGEVLRAYKSNGRTYYKPFK